MPVYMITMHAYRSWSEDNPKGYHQRGEHGIKPPDQERANQRARIANDPPILFNASQQYMIIDLIEDILKRRDIRLHAASITATHLHFIASWFGKESVFTNLAQCSQQTEHLANNVKNILSTALSKQHGEFGKRWFSRGSGCTLVSDRQHLNHLIEHYLPKHVEEGGVIRRYGTGDTR